MAEVIIMPKLGYNMDEGQLVKWCKREGEAVKKGEVLFEINTDKTTMPVEATADGVLLRTLLAEGDYAPVFTPIAVVGQLGEDVAAALAGAGSASGAGANAAFAESDSSGAQQAVGDGSPALPSATMAGRPGERVEAVAMAAGEQAAATESDSVGTQHAAAPGPGAEKLLLTPKAKRLVREEGIDPASLKQVRGTGYRGGITAADIKASPLARRLAEAGGVDLAAVTGSGAGGRIMRADVEAAARQEAPAEDGKLVLRTEPYKGVRKIIGERLSASKFSAPHLYFTESVDTSGFTAFRATVNETGGEKVAVSDLLVMACSKALQEYPGINVSLVDDQVVTYRSTNIGVAVAGENGLVVPVIKNVQQKTLRAVARESRDLVARAMLGQLAQHEYSGGTFTISNLGMFGIENFTAIINPPESAILAVSSVRKQPVAVAGPDGEDLVAVRPMMNIQLSVDHRVIDGLLAVRFLGCLKDLLEHPLKILL